MTASVRILRKKGVQILENNVKIYKDTQSARAKGTMILLESCGKERKTEHGKSWREQMQIPTEHEANVFGQLDTYAKKIERTFHVTLIERNGEIKIMGEEGRTKRAQEILEKLLELSRRGNVITEQNVNYLISLAMEDEAGDVLEMDKEVIAYTVQGKPVKAKTLGQKSYVDAMKKT